MSQNNKHNGKSRNTGGYKITGQRLMCIILAGVTVLSLMGGTIVYLAQ